MSKKDPEWNGKKKSEWRYWKECDFCGQEFGTNRLDQINCSKECRLKKVKENKKANNNWNDPVECVICYDDFIPAVHNQMTCSPKCSYKLSLKRSKENEKTLKEERNSSNLPIKENCIVCDREFEQKNDRHICCSQECADIRKAILVRQNRIEGKSSYSEDKIEKNVKASTDDLISEMHKRGFFVTKQPETTGERFEVDMTMFEGDVMRFAVMSDTHLCSKQQQLSHLRSFYRLCADREIEMVLHIGDLCEGTGKQHEGQIYDLFIHGQDEQTDYIVENYPRETGITTHFILGSHDESFWKMSGYDIGRRVSEQRDDMKYLGFADAYIDIAPNVDINLHHPDGGTAYALSYNAQKRVEAYPPELKPRIALFGHYHRCMWMPAYRNVDAFLVPCFQSQTLFLKKKKIYPIIGGWLIDVTINEDGLARVQPECIRFYEPIDNDY